MTLKQKLRFRALGKTLRPSRLPQLYAVLRRPHFQHHRRRREHRLSTQMYDTFFTIKFMPLRFEKARPFETLMFSSFNHSGSGIQIIWQGFKNNPPPVALIPLPYCVEWNPWPTNNESTMNFLRPFFFILYKKWFSLLKGSHVRRPNFELFIT